MKNRYSLFLVLFLSALSGHAQQVDQPVNVLVDIDVGVMSVAQWAFAGADFGTGTHTVLIEDGGIGQLYGEASALIPVGKEVSVAFDCGYIDSVELLFTPPPGYLMLIEDEATVYMESDYPTGGSIETFNFRIKVLPIGGLSGLPAGDVSFPEIGKFRWNIGLGYMPNGRSAGFLTIKETTLSAIYDRSNLGSGARRTASLKCFAIPTPTKICCASAAIF